MPHDEGRNAFAGLLGGSWDFVSKVISPLIEVIRKYKYSYLNYITLLTKSHDP